MYGTNDMNYDISVSNAPFFDQDSTTYVCQLLIKNLMLINDWEIMYYVVTFWHIFFNVVILVVYVVVVRVYHKLNPNHVINQISTTLLISNIYAQWAWMKSII